MITMLLLGIVLVGITVSAIIVNQLTKEASEQEMIASSVAEGANELSYLANDYLVYRESQQLKRWQTKFASFSNQVARLSLHKPEQQVIIRSIQANQQRLKEVFDSVASHAGRPSQNQSAALDPAFFQVSWSRMAVQSQGLISDASRLSRLLDQQTDQLREIRTVLMYVMVGLFGILLLASYMLTYRHILKSIMTLQAGTAVIGSGDLDFKIEEKKNDEIGDLSRAFNRMTANLKDVTASKEELEKEITERKRAEEKLREQREWLRVTLSSIGDAVIATDIKGQVTFLNPVAITLTGWKSEEALNQPIESVFRIMNEKTRAPAEDLVARVLNEKRVVGLANDTVLVAKDGHEIPIEDSAAPILDAAGSMAGIVLVFHDVTEKRRAQAALREAHEHAIWLARFPEQNPNPVMRASAEGTVLYCNPASTKFPGLRGEVGQRLQNELLPLFDRAMKEGKELQWDVEIQGRVYFIWIAPFPKEGYANIYARDITARKQAEKAIQEAREYAESITATVREPLIVLDTGLRVVSANRSFFQTFRVNQEETYGRLIYELGGRQWDIPRLRELLEAILPKNTVFDDFEVDHEFPGIGRRIMLLNGRRLYRETNKTEMILLAVEDITERKRAEEALHDAQKLVKANLDAMTRLQKLGTLFVHEGNLEPILGEIVDAAIAISGADFGNIQLLDLKSSDLKIAAQRGFPKWWLDFWNGVSKGQGACGTALERGERVIVEDIEKSPIFVSTPALEIQLKAGVRAVQSTPLVSRMGKPLGMFSTHYKRPHRPDDRVLGLLDLLARQTADIIERAQAEEAVHESEQRLSRAQEIAHLGSWELDVINNRLTWSDEVYRIFGLRPQEFGATYEAFLEAVHPDDRAAVDAAYSGSLKEGRDTYEIEHRVVRKSTGEIRIVLERCEHIRDASGQIIRSIGMVHDITERKQMEEQLRQSEEKARLLIQYAPSMFYEIDFHGPAFISVNDLMCQVLGYTREELLAMNPFDLLDDEGKALFRDRIRRKFAGEEISDSVEYKSKTKDGREVYGVLNMSFTYKDGKPEGAVVVAHDITERKRAEEALRKAYDELERRVQERTEDLAKANEALRQLSSRLLSAQEEERKRIAGEIHDTLGSCLSAIKFKVESLFQGIGGTARVSTESMNSIIPVIQEGIEDCRRIQMDLRPSMLDDLGLLPTLSWFCKRFRTIYSGIGVEQEMLIEENQIPNSLKIVIYRVIQEAMNNIAKHSYANRVRLSLRKCDGKMELFVEDNGHGFSVQQSLFLDNSRRGLGLTSMRERTELSGGSFAIESAEGKGTIIRAWWPI